MLLKTKNKFLNNKQLNNFDKNQTNMINIVFFLLWFTAGDLNLFLFLYFYL